MMNIEYRMLMEKRFKNHDSAINAPLRKFAFYFAVRAVFSLFAAFVVAPFCFVHSNPRDKSRGY